MPSRNENVIAIEKRYHSVITIRGKNMTGRNTAQERAMILLLLSDETMETGAMYLAYPKGYDQGVAVTNNRLYDNFVRLQFQGKVLPEVGRILR